MYRYNRIFILLLLILPKICFSYATGIADYHVTHMPNTQELHVTAKFDVEGHTEIALGASLKRSDVESIVNKLNISIDESRVTRKGLSLSFDSPLKESVVISYIIKNSTLDSSRAFTNPYIDKEGFYFDNGFLALPNTRATDALDLLLKARIKFNTPSSNIIFSSRGEIKNNAYMDWSFIVNKRSLEFYIGDVFYISGSPKILKKSRIKVNNSPINLLFFKLPQKSEKVLKDKVQKIYNAVHKLFGEMAQSKSIPFTAFVNNERTNLESNGSGTNINGSIVYYINHEATQDDIMYHTTLAHEYIHNWVVTNVVDKPFQHIWFTEGFVEYYAKKVSFAEGMLSNIDVIYNVNYDNAIANLSDLRHKSYLEIESAKYEFMLFYYKGFLLASELDQKIITATKGKSSLDDVMRSLVKKFQSGTKFSTELLKSEIKQISRSSFDDIFNAIEYGKKFTPTPTPFGIKTKLKYIPAYIPKYDFDIDAAVITQKITKLDKNSPAYKAGLRDGDFYPRDRNNMQSEANPGPQTVTLIVADDKGEKTITYVTECEQIMVPQYEIVE